MATVNEQNGFYKLSWAQRIGFGSGDLAQNLIFQTVACYLMLDLTTVLKINPAFVSGLILGVRLLDCVWSP
ncbi:MAG: MFS transporter, partial [Bacteroidales bacterium]|nr:MFS transporter [Bacteroidales bacterium]